MDSYQLSESINCEQVINIISYNEAKYEVNINLWVSGSGFLHLDLPRFLYTDIRNTEPFLATKIKFKRIKFEIERKA